MKTESSFREKMVSDLSYEDFESIEELASKNKSTKEIRELLQINGRSFMASFKDKESALYKAFKRGIDQMDVQKEDALLQRIADGNLTAIQIHNDGAKKVAFKNAVHRIFGI